MSNPVGILKSIRAATTAVLGITLYGSEQSEPEHADRVVSGQSVEIRRSAYRSHLHLEIAIDEGARILHANRINHCARKTNSIST